MARAAYLAPGVYVEEVPSAQQPIAGVGTNTVGFIGVVPKKIQCPVPNDEYDPTLAQQAAGGPAGNEQQVKQVSDEIKNLEDKRTQAQQALDQVIRQLAEEGLADNRKRTLETQKQRREQEIQQFTNDIATRNQRLQELRAPRAVDEKFLKPYKFAGGRRQR